MFFSSFSGLSSFACITCVSFVQLYAIQLDYLQLLRSVYISTDMEHARQVPWQTKQYSYIVSFDVFISIVTQPRSNRHGPCAASIRGKNILSLRFMSVRDYGYLPGNVNRASEPCRRLLLTTATQLCISLPQGSV